MSEALCGPSNAMQSFQKHSQVDRTLQQDRLVGIQPTALEPFRSTSSHAESLEADFHAFQSGASHLPLTAVMDRPWSNMPQSMLFNEMSGTLPQPNQTSWVDEFRSLQFRNQDTAAPSLPRALTDPRIPRQISGHTVAPYYRTGPVTTPHLDRYQAMTAAGPFVARSMQQTRSVAVQDAAIESAFAQAFDDAQNQVLAQAQTQTSQDIAEGHMTESSSQVRSLRFAIIESLDPATERSTHQLALYFALLEELDLASISSQELSSLVQPLRFIQENPQHNPFFARYGLVERARELLSSATRADQGVPMTSDIRAEQSQTEERLAKAARFSDQSRSVATDAEMQNDLAMQIVRLSHLPQSERISAALAGSTVPEVSTVATPFEDVNQGSLPAQVADAQTRPQTTEREDTEAPRDQLAAVAGELLEKVADNRSEKFQNSTFLDLMRKLHNREVQVEGDKMVRSNSAASTAPSQIVEPLPSLSPKSPQYSKASVVRGGSLSSDSAIPADGQAVVDLLNTTDTPFEGASDLVHGAYAQEVDSRWRHPADPLPIASSYDEPEAEISASGLFEGL